MHCLYNSNLAKDKRNLILAFACHPPSSAFAKEDTVIELDPFVRVPRVAYFSMEIALAPDIPTYSGGLGVLAGDTLRTAADLDLPMVGVTLACKMGYLHQLIDPEGNQTERPDPWYPQLYASSLGAKVAVLLEGREVWVSAWLYVLKGYGGKHQVPVVLLDTDLEENQPQDREITHYLYGGDLAYRLKQEAVLGIGGIRMLQALGSHERAYHLNEGHSALLTLELLRRHAYAADEVRPGELHYDIPEVRGLCNFTTHTPVEAGHDRFSYDLVQKILGEKYFDLELLKTLGGKDELNMTLLALNLSEYVNGVSKKHEEVSEKLFPGYHVHAITNGVHPFTWTSPPFARLYDEYIPSWCHEPELLVRADRIPSDLLWQAHLLAKKRLVAYILEKTGVSLSLDLPIFGFARRMTAYKRPELIFSDIERLRGIAKKTPFQLIFAGKAHPHDQEGKACIARVHQRLLELKDIIPGVYLPGYDMAMAALMVAGCDVWVNTPLSPMEASGTSGMKAALNGVPQFSVLDGWWAEGCIEGGTGWAIGNGGEDGKEDGNSLYDKLENVILPLYHKDRDGWIAVMKETICKNGAFFNSTRMMRRYAAEAYLP